MGAPPFLAGIAVLVAALVHPGSAQVASGGAQPRVQTLAVVPRRVLAVAHDGSWLAWRTCRDVGIMRLSDGAGRRFRIVGTDPT
jgi:hypothetical protein